MTENDLSPLAQSFQQSRAQLLRMAHRMLGSAAEADDALQEVWLKVSQADAQGVDNLGGWLTTVTARVCLDHLRSRTARASHEDHDAAPLDAPAPQPDAESEVLAAESLSLALLLVLEALQPAERVAFVLHDLFGVGFDEVARVLERSPEAARQLASRARRRVRGGAETDEATLARQRASVEALLAALRAGDVEGVVAVLDPDVVVRAEAPTGRINEIRGARNWARPAMAFARGASEGIELALVDGRMGAIYAPDGKLTRVLRFTFTAQGTIATVDIIGPSMGLDTLHLAVAPPRSRS